MPPEHGGAAKRPIGKTWGKPKKTKENNLLSNGKLNKRKPSRKENEACFFLFLFVFICFFFVRTHGAIPLLRMAYQLSIINYQLESGWPPRYFPAVSEIASLSLGVGGPLQHHNYSGALVCLFSIYATTLVS